MSWPAAEWPPRAPSLFRRLEISDWRDARWFLKRYWPLALCFGLIGAAAGGAWIYFSPPAYVSEAKVRFLPPQVAGKFVDPNFAMQVEQRLYALSQMLSSRLTATRMIETFQLYPERRRFQTITDLTPKFRDDLKLTQLGSAPGESGKTIPTLAICFRYPDAERGQKVVQKLIEQIYEENRKYRGDQSLGATEFLGDQLKAAEEKVLEAEARLGDVQDALRPNTSQILMGESTSRAYVVDSRLRDLRHDMRGMEERRAAKSAEVAQLEVHVKTIEARSWEYYLPQTDVHRSLWVAYDRVAAAELHVKRMREYWKAGMPDRDQAEQDVKAAHEVANRLRQELAARFKEQDIADTKAKLMLSVAERRGLDTEVARAQKEELELRAESQRLRDQTTPPAGLEADLLLAKREYELARESFTQLQKKFDESKTASEMERRGQGETVELLEPPSLGTQPEAPGVMLRMIGAIVGGLFMGAGVGMIIAMRRVAIVHEGNVEKWAGLPVLASFPKYEMREEPVKREKKKNPPSKQTWRRKTVTTAVLLLAVTASGCTDRFLSAETFWQRGQEAEKKGALSAAAIFYRQAVRKDAKFAKAHAAAGRLALRLNDLAAAKESLLRAVELQPAEAELQVLLADATYQLYFGDPARPAVVLREVEALAEGLRAKWPERADGYRIQSHVLLERHRPDEAIAVLRNAIQTVRSNEPLRAQLAAALFRSGDGAEAELVLRELIASKPAYTESYDLLYLQLMEQRKGEAAKAVLGDKWRNTGRADAAIQLAGHFDTMGDRDGAANALRELSEKRPAESGVMARIGDFWMYRAEWERARAAYDAGLATDSSQRALYTGRIAEWHMAQGHIDDARKLLEKEASTNRADATIDTYLASIRLNDTSKEVRTAQREKLEIIAQKTPDSAFVRYHLGRAYLAEANLRGAAEQFDRCVKLDANYSPAWVALAEIELRSGNAPAAEMRAGAVLRSNPAFLPAIMTKARAQIARGKAVDAARSLEQVLAIQPDNNEALFWLAGSHMARRDASKALTLLAQGKKRDAGNPRWLLAEAQALASTGKVPEARAQLEAARKSENVTEEILQNLASLQLAMRDGEAAANTYQALRVRNGSSLEYQLGQAGSLALSGDMTKAMALYEAIEKSAGNDARPWLQHAALLNQMGQKEKAFALYEEALRRDKNNPLILNNLAWALLERGGPAERALEFAQQAKRIAGRSPQIDDTLAAAYSKLAMYRNAIAVYEEMLTYLPPSQQGEVVKQLEAAKRMSAKKGGPA